MFDVKIAGDKRRCELTTEGESRMVIAYWARDCWRLEEFEGSFEAFTVLLKYATVFMEMNTTIKVLSIQSAHDINENIREDVKKCFKNGFCQSHKPSNVRVFCSSFT